MHSTHERKFLVMNLILKIAPKLSPNKVLLLLLPIFLGSFRCFIETNLFREIVSNLLFLTQRWFIQGRKGAGGGVKDKFQDTMMQLSQ